MEVRIYSEFHSGPLEDEKAFAWPEMLVLTGVTSSFDRMRHLAAYARTKSPGCVIVAGGPVVRSLPLSAAAIFDYACHGDVEDLAEIAREVFGPDARSLHYMPRFDLLSWRSPVNYVESSRYCNFHCTFCSLTGEARPYRSNDLGYVEAQIRAYKSRKIVLFLDNNFYGNNRSFFLGKLDLLRRLRDEGLVPGWIALVTSDFFLDPLNLGRVRDAGCLGLFSGVESFNANQLRRYNKKQNLTGPQVQTIKNCLEAGIVFQYGLIFDPTSQSVREMQDELSFVFDCHSIPLPAFLSLTIPLLGTPYFQRCVDERMLLPLTKLRDMDGFTLVTKSIDEVDKIVPFVRGMSQLEGYGSRVIMHNLRFWRTYRRALSMRQMTALLANSARLCLPRIIHNRTHPWERPVEDLTYVTTTQPLGPLYRPAFPIDSRYEDYFTPTMVTDREGHLDERIAANMASYNYGLGEPVQTVQ